MLLEVDENNSNIHYYFIRCLHIEIDVSCDTNLIKKFQIFNNNDIDSLFYC